MGDDARGVGDQLAGWVQLLLQRVKRGDCGLYQQFGTPVIIVRQAVEERAMGRAEGDYRCRGRRYRSLLARTWLSSIETRIRGPRQGAGQLAAQLVSDDARARAIGDGSS